MAPFRDVLNPESEFWEACARHTNRQTARKIQAVYLCDECAIRLTREAFNDRPPIHHGETLQGFCGLCNESRSVVARFWFACDICWNIVQAYQKAKAASQAVHTYWNEQCAASFPKLKLIETEPVYLAPYHRGGKTKRQAAETLDALDFRVERIGGAANQLFHIELKAGPGSIEQMNEFQLDITIRMTSLVWPTKRAYRFTFFTWNCVMFMPRRHGPQQPEACGGQISLRFLKTGGR